MKGLLRQYWKRGALLTTVLIIIMIFIVPPIVHYVIRNKIESTMHTFEKVTHQRIRMGPISFPRNATLVIPWIEAGDSSVAGKPWIFRASNVRLDFYVWGFLTGNYVQHVTVDSLEGHILRLNDSVTNVTGWKPFFVRAESVSSGVSADENLVARFMDRYLQKKLPSMEIGQWTLTYREVPKRKWSKPTPPLWSFENCHVSVREGFFRNAELDGSGILTQSGERHAVTASGTLDHGKRELSLQVFFDSSVRLPDLHRWIDADAWVKGFSFRLKGLEQVRDVHRLKAQLDVEGLDIMAEALSTEKLSNVNLGFDLDLGVTSDSVAVHDGTRIYLNRISAFITGSAAGLKSKPRLRVHLGLPTIGVTDFLNSIPRGLIKKLDGAKVQGSMSYEASLALDMAHVDSVKFDPVLTTSPDFKLITPGDSISFTFLRDTFQYVFKKDNDEDSAIWIAPSNPFYRSLDSIPSILTEAVIACEDNSFFKNDGFNVLQIERSLRDNIKEKKFARGASTISMQLVKNIYLSREKTIARKLQELLITWLMNEGLALGDDKDKVKQKELHKKRLMEIYLNMIEWGPNIHGAASASKFYFRKDPKDLTIGEAVFLATIIPNPKKYERYFEDGVSKKKHVDFMNLIVKMLYDKKVIPKDSMESNIPCHFKVTGPAARLIEHYLPKDSLDLHDFEEPLVN